MDESNNTDYEEYTEGLTKNYREINEENLNNDSEDEDKQDSMSTDDNHVKNGNGEQKKRGRRPGLYGPYKKTLYRPAIGAGRNEEQYKTQPTIKKQQMQIKNDIKLQNISSQSFGRQKVKSNLLEPEPVLEVKSITKIYKGTLSPVFTDLSFALYRGDIVGILGQNGAGKSTLLKCITGLTPIDGGFVKVSGLALDDARDKFSVLWVEAGMNYGWTVKKNLQFWSLAYGIPYNEVEVKKILSVFGVSHLLDKEYKYLSTGQKRKVSIARTFFKKSDLYILDEATSGLDFTSQANIQQFIKNHERQNHAGYLLVTHLYTDLINLCNKLMIIDSGKIVDYATTYDIKRKYLTGYVVTLLIEGQNEIVDAVDEYLRAKGAKYFISRKDSSAKIKPIYIKLDNDVSEYNEYSGFLQKYSLQKKVDKLDLEVFVNLLMSGIIFSENNAVQ